MSFKASDLSVLAYANNFTLWHYRTVDESIGCIGYFTNARDMLRTGDLIIANTSIEASPATKFYIVTGVADNVTVALYA